MELITWELTGKSVNEMTTEIRFFIATASVKRVDVFKLKIKKVFSDEREAKRFASIKRILQTVKRDGLIQLYIHSDELSGNTTEAAYITNKYPDMCVSDEDNNGFIVKL